MPAVVRTIPEPAVRVASAQSSALASVSVSSSTAGGASAPRPALSPSQFASALSQAASSTVPTPQAALAAATPDPDSRFSITLGPGTSSTDGALPPGGTIITQTIGPPTTPTSSTTSTQQTTAPAGTITVVQVVPPSSSSTSSVLASIFHPSSSSSPSSVLVTPSTSTTATAVASLSLSSASPTPTGKDNGNKNGTGSGRGGGDGNKSEMNQMHGAKPQGAAASPSPVNPAVIAVPIVLVVLLFLAGGVFFVRRHFIQKRQHKRDTWGAGIYPRAPLPDVGVAERDYEQAHMAGVAPGMPASAPPPMAMAMPAPVVYVSEPPREPSIISTLPTPTYPTSPMSMAGGGFGAGATVPSGATARAAVKCGFVPSLPDELPIAAGDAVRVLAEYDDGWALCEDTQGAQGMVPLDCLERGAGPTTPLSTTSFAGARSQRRVSSLAGAGIRG